MSRCISTTEVTWTSGGKTAIQCRRDLMHDGDHEGRIDGYGMQLTWPSVETAPFVIYEYERNADRATNLVSSIRSLNAIKTIANSAPPLPMLTPEDARVFERGAEQPDYVFLNGEHVGGKVAPR